MAEIQEIARRLRFVIFMKRILTKSFEKTFAICVKFLTPKLENGTAVTILEDFDDEIPEIPQPIMETSGLLSLIDWKAKTGYSCEICSKVLSSKNNLKAWFR